MGRPRAGGARRLRRGAARPRRRGALPDRAAHRDARRARTARNHAITSALAGLHLGDTLRDYLARLLRDASPERADRRTSPPASATTRCAAASGWSPSLLASDDFLIDPLPNLLFTRDSSVWVRDRVAVTSLAMPARTRETQLTELIYTEHPRFAGTRKIHGWHHEHVEGGDVLLLAPGRDRGRRRRADDARRRRAARPPGLPRRPRAHRARRADRAGARHHAPRHRLHDGRRRQDRDVPQRRRHPARRTPSRCRRPGRRRARPDARRRRAPSRSWSPPRRRWRSTRCTRSTPASTRSPPSASSGTTATTPWRSRRGSRSPTSATTRPTTGSRRPASRSSGSPAPSSARAAAARAA